MTRTSDLLLDRQSGSNLNEDRDDTIDVGTDVGFSGTFIRLERDGKLAGVCKLIEQHRRIENDLVLVHAELRGCNHPMVLAKFVSLCRIGKRDFERELRCAVKQLESARGLLETKLAEIERQLEQFEVTIPTLHGSADLVSYPQQKIVPRQPRLSGCFSLCDTDQCIRISMKTNWRKRVRVERTDDIRDAVRRF